MVTLLSVVRIFGVLLFLLILLPLLPAQEKLKRNEIRLQSGWSRFLVRDELQSIFAYRGSSAPVSLTYRRNNPRLRHGVQLFFNTVDLNNEVSSAAVDGLLLFIEPRLQWSLPSESRFHFWLGGAWKNQVFIRDFDYRISGPDFSTTAGEVSGEGFSSLHLLGNADYTLAERHLFGLELKLGLLSYLISRDYNPQWLPSVWELDTFVGPGQYWEVENRLYYQFALSERFDLRFTYIFHYYQYRRSVKTQVANQQLLAGVGFKF